MGVGVMLSSMKACAVAVVRNRASAVAASDGSGGSVWEGVLAGFIVGEGSMVDVLGIFCGLARVLTSDVHEIRITNNSKNAKVNIHPVWKVGLSICIMRFAA